MEVDDVAVQEGPVGAEERVTWPRSRYGEIMKMNISVAYVKGI
jgi:hypothetical protein